MENGSPSAETQLATITYTASDFVEVRFKDGVTLSTAALAEVMQVRARLGVAGKHRAMIVLQEVVDFEMSMITTDHYGHTPQPHTVAVAWVVHNERNEHFTRLYLAYWPPPFPSGVFLKEVDARAWLETIAVGQQVGS